MKRGGARLGQHFLKNGAYARMLAHAAKLSAGDTVVEIGPGKGALTKELLATGAKVIAVEKDEALATRLRATFLSEISRRGLDILAQDIRNFMPPHEPYTVAANIPYYITGEIIRQFLTAQHQPGTMSLCVQKEVAQVIVAQKESILSLSVNAYGTPKIVAKVSRKHFSPPPSVDSAILLIENISRDFFAEISEEDFFTVVRAGFAAKRKMLANNLSNEFEKETVLAALAYAGADEKARAEDVALPQWKLLAQRLVAAGLHHH